jgi:phosphate-selective porin OprO/OprP
VIRFLLLATLFVAVVVQPSMADSVESFNQRLLDILRAQGAITEEQHRELRSNAEASPTESDGSFDRRLLEVLLAQGAITEAQYAELARNSELEPSAPAHVSLEGEDPNGVKVELGAKGFRARTNDGRFKFGLGGRLHLDAAGHPGHLPDVAPGVKANPTDGIEVRRGRIRMSATVFEDWDFLFNVDFADDQVAVKDLLFSYNGFSWGRLTAGSQKQPYSLAVEMSSNDMPFVERGIDNDLIIPFVDRALGGRFDSHGKNWQAAIGIYGDNIDPTEELDEGWGFAARGVFAPIRDEEKVLHLGFRNAYREPSSEGGRRARVRTETTHFSNLFISNTGPILNTKRVVLYGPEVAFAWGPFSIFGEYNFAWFDVKDASNLNYHSGHVGATWSLTGESRAAAYTMKSGEFKRLRPHDNFSLAERTWGAFELAARYAYIDVSDGPVQGGEEGRLSTSFNWYLNPAVRMMFDFTHVTNADNGSIITNTASGTNILTYRMQFAF